jgi:lipopolysaccharide/colanic/teichoic acid biosynthesis glycosyltransferase
VSTTTTARQNWSIIEHGSGASVATFRPSITPATIRFLAQEAMRPRERTGRERAVRALNVVVAAVAILLAAPLMLLIALGITATSKGPVIYKQPRIGLDRRKSRGPEALNHRRRADVGGRVFTIYKFRTMRPTGDTPQQVWASQDDPRITSVGRLLRAFRLDEVPQLFNVLKGDMSLVGPRPTIMEQVRAYDDFQRRRLEVRPGLTGLAQVNGNAAIPWDERIKYDVYYVDHVGPLLDLSILFKTVLVIVMGEGRFTRPFEESPYARLTG